MTISSEREAGQAIAPVAGEQPVSRRSVLRTIAGWSQFRRVSLASAGLFSGVAALGAHSATAGNWHCCSLVYPAGPWCCNNPGNPEPFWCCDGGFKRTWYCCEAGALYMCGECQSGTGTCFNGPDWYCSYGANTGHC